MLKDFESKKKQLSELADVINKFKSEAVQIRLLELLFAGEPIEDESEVEEEAAPKTKTRKRKSRAKKKSGAKKKTSAKKKAPSRSGRSGGGAISIVNQLFDEGFFSEARTIADICSHSETNLARKIKQNEISGKLGRMVRDKDLKRKKNSDNQYEYTKA